jgi:ribosomal protein S18 acetylase RimI-like enzyme
VSVLAGERTLEVESTHVVRFRPFRNSDPPLLFQLLRKNQLGRGTATPASVAALEQSVFGLPYFDPAGLIIAEEEGDLLGFVHAGFGFTEQLDELDRSKGVICAILVDSSRRREGLGRELLGRAEEYLKAAGSTSIQAGQSRYIDPFYFGLYGGARPSGFLESDPDADPFFTASGYPPAERIGVFQRDLTDRKDPMNFRILALRRQTELVASDQPQEPTWWWYTHFGNIESMRFRLLRKSDGQRIAGMTVVGLDHFITKWGERVIGLVDVSVEESYRGQGYGQALIVETLRRLRTELVTRAEIHVPEENEAATKAVEGAGFSQVDTGIVYRKG